VNDSCVCADAGTADGGALVVGGRAFRSGRMRDWGAAGGFGLEGGSRWAEIGELHMLLEAKVSLTGSEGDG